jgi:predicted XRE-type DNA-binding protein
MKKRFHYSLSDGNVYADLGLPEAGGRMLKAQLAVQIRRFIEEKRWTLGEAAGATGLDTKGASNLLRGILPRFSFGQLLNILNRLGHSVEVRISAEETDPDEAQTLVTLV